MLNFTSLGSLILRPRHRLDSRPFVLSGVAMQAGSAAEDGQALEGGWQGLAVPDSSASRFSLLVSLIDLFNKELGLIFRSSDVCAKWRCLGIDLL
ncbi:hypothetical protein Ddc_17849 [Ditylenchus destructor]|nr:hypothetical protein Ddc_17849 [Ditylenchus destructor]